MDLPQHDRQPVAAEHSRPGRREEFATVDRALAAVARGEPVVVLDDADRENEGDLVVAAETATEDTIAFMVRHTSGVLCVPMEGPRLDELALPLMVASNTDAHQTAFTVSTDHRSVSTGISAADRAATARALADPGTTAADLRRPGHVFPLRSHPMGVLGRPGHTEAAVDLARLAGLRPAGVISEVVRADGATASVPDLASLAADHGLVMISIADLVRYRRRHERLVREVGRADLPTRHGRFRAVGVASEITGIEHVALVMGDPTGDPPLVRVHSECLTGDAFGSLRCDCGEQLEAGLAAIAAEGRGVLVYLRGHEGRGIGLGGKLRAYGMQDRGRDTVEANEELGYPADARQYGIAAQILTHLGVGRLRLITNNPAKTAGLVSYGLDVVARVPSPSRPTPENRHYLHTKQHKLGHLLDVEVAS